MTALQLRIIKRAINNRLNNGEDFNEIILSYPKLSEEEILEIKEEFGIVDSVEDNIEEPTVDNTENTTEETISE